MLVDNHVAHSLCPGIERVDFTNTALYAVIEKEYGITIDWAMRLFKAIAAEGEIAQILEVTEGEPIMLVEHLVYDTLGRCIDVANLWLRSDKMSLSMILKRK
jgi:DNA-binding GntR family transcriptional regulator